MQNTLIAPIEEAIAEKHILKHPFYQAWQQGELTMPALQDYATQYYRHVAAFPTYLSALHSHTEDIETRQILLDNLIDEEHGTANHPELWLRFAKALGVPREEALAAKIEPEAEAIVQTFRAICRDRSVAEGLAALYAYESQIPAVAETKIQGLKEHYNISSDEALAYFTVHEIADVAHSAEERALLTKHVDAANAAGSEQAAREALNALWNLLSGVCRRHGIDC